MPPPIPLSGAADWYSAGSQSGSASSSANRGLRASQACSGDVAAAIVAWTSATNERTTAVSRTKGSLMSVDSDRNALLPPEAVHAGVVLPEPVAEAVPGDANGPERVLHVLEQDFPARDRLPVAFPGESAEADPARTAATPDGDDIEEVSGLAGDELDVLGTRLARFTAGGSDE